MQKSTLEMLDKAREIAGIPFRITSGTRCEKFNKVVGGASNSAHLRGYAADISAVYSRHRLAIVKALLQVGFNRIGIYSHHLHSDNDPNAPPDVMWHSAK